MHPFRLLTAVLCSILSFIPVGFITEVASADVHERTFGFDVQLRPGVTANVSVTILGRDPVVPFCYGACAKRINILAVPGLTHAAASFRPWAEHVLNDPTFRSKVSKIFLLDFPGHGGSGLPEPGDQLQFGNLTLQDYQATLIQALAELELRGCKIRALVAHSLGGLVTQMAQDALVSEGNSLRDEFGVRDVILIGSSFPQQVPWAFVDSGAFGQVAPQFIKVDPILGTYFGVDPANWLGLFFTSPLQQFAPHTPSPQQVIDGGYIANEPLVVGLQLGSLNGLTRPGVERGIFSPSKGTQLTVVAMDQDIYSVFPGEQTFLLSYLTDKNENQAKAKLKTVTGADAVHDVMITSPESLDAILKDALN